MDKINNCVFNEYKTLTYIHNLQKVDNEKELYLSFNKTIRNSINWCNNNNITFNVYNNNNFSNRIIADFVKMCKKTYKSKGLKIHVNKTLIKSYLKSNSLIITTTQNKDNKKDRVFHAYQVSDKRAILWYSCSLHNINNAERNAIGKENRFLHYKDMLYFKDMGITYYDWGGISRSNPNDSIALFKKSFEGGYEEWVYSYKYLKTKKAKLANKLHLI